ncbi:hypothetical protein FBR02_13370 [Anaerolineae bacterium CFX9]|nr:hypothetical protein [Anaerolineae bacterium CFX9]
MLSETTRSRRGGDGEGRPKTGQLSGVQILFAAILSIGLILSINFSARISESQPIQEAYESAVREIDQLRREQQRLIEQRDYVRSDAYVENWARSDGKMVRPGEVLVIPVPSGITVEDTPDPQVFIDALQTEPPAPEPWQLWWQLFLDAPPPEF